MRKLTLGFAILFLAVLMASGLIWAQHDPGVDESKEAEEASSTMDMPHCQKATPCHKTQTMSSSMMPMCCTMMPHMMGGKMPMMKMRLGGLPERGDPLKRALIHLRGPDFFANHAKKLDLSEDQVADLKALKWNHRKTAIEKEADIQIALVEFEELLDQEPLNFDKIKAKIIDIGDLEQEGKLALLNSIQKAHNILTAEQLEKAKSLQRVPHIRKKCVKKSPSPAKKKESMMEQMLMEEMLMEEKKK
jgi:hypothetical protein